MTKSFMTNIVQSTTYIYIYRERERESRPIKWGWSRLRKKIESRSEVEGPRWVMQEIIENHQKLLLQLVKGGGAWVSQHPPSAPSKNSRSGISWMGWNCLSPRGQFTWSVYLFFFCSFFSLAQFFFPCKGFFYHFFFCPPLTPSFL
jgi:hypothetical protein